MDSSILVGRDLSDGEDLLAELDREGMPIAAAFWRYPTAESDGGMVIATPLVDELGPLPVYQRLQAVLSRLPGRQLPLSDIFAVGEQDSVARRLRQALAPNATRNNFSTSVRFSSYTPYAPYLSENDTGVSLFVYRLTPESQNTSVVSAQGNAV